MKKDALTFWLTVVLVAVALVASAVLLVDYVRPAPVFCEANGGCARVRETAFARPLGIPLPAIGILGLLAIGLAALVPGQAARRVQAALGIVAGLNAALLLGVQAKMGVLCPYCAVVDVASLGLAGVSFLRWRRSTDPPSGRGLLALAVGALVLAIALPLAVGFRRRVLPSGLPIAIAEEMKQTGRGKVTVVDFVDFECPFCRMTHAELAPLVAARKDKLRVARKHVPLRMHPHALDAAKAGCCGEVLGKGDEMADALFTAPLEALTPEGCEKLAVAQGLDRDRFRQCVEDPATEARIEKDKESFKAAKGHGLPTIWVDDAKLEGQQDRASLQSTLDAAIRSL